MTTNKFIKQIKVLFSEFVNRTNDSLIMAKIATPVKTSSTESYRSNDEFWRRVQYISVGYDQRDISSLSGNFTDLSVKARMNQVRVDFGDLTNDDLRDMTTFRQKVDAAMRGLDTRINLSLLDAASKYGTLVVARPNQLNSFDDVAACDTLVNQTGVGYGEEKHLVLSPRDYNQMAGNLAQRGTMIGLPDKAYKEAYVGRVSSFDTKKLQYTSRIRAAGISTATIDTTAAAGNYWIPVASYISPLGEPIPYDYRYQTITVSSNAQFQSGDAFTIDGVYGVHLQSKTQSPDLKTFRVISVQGSNQMTISPSIISGQGGTKQERDYQNVFIIPSATAAITLLNKNAADINPFFCEGALEFYPGNPTSVDVKGSAWREAITNNIGITYVMMGYDNPDAWSYRFRVDALWGVNIVSPEKAGILIGNQA